MNGEDAKQHAAYHAAKFSSSVGAAACFIIIPLTDTIRIIILRISRGQSPITPDKNHIHHGLIRLGLSHAKSSILLAALNLLFIGLAFLLRDFSNGYTLTAIVILSSTLCVILDRLLFRRVSS